MTDGINDAVVPPADDTATDDTTTKMPDPMAETPAEGVEAPKVDGEEGMDEDGAKDPMADDADEEATPATPAL